MRRRLSILFSEALLLAVVGLACSGTPSSKTRGPEAPVGPPVEVDLERAGPEVAELVRELIRAASAAPRDGGRRAELGMAYETNGFASAAMRCYEQAWQLQPEEPRWSYLWALLRAQTGDLEGALDVMQHSVEADGSYVPAHLYRAKWLFDLGRVDEAERSYRRALELDSGSAAAAAGLARVLIRLDRPEEAVALLEPYAAARPRDGYLHQLLGTAYRDTGQIERAKQALARVRPGVDPPAWPDPWTRAKTGFVAGYGAEMRRGEALLAEGRFAEAARVFERLREQRPDDLALLNNLGVAYRRAGSVDQAQALLEASTRDHPDYFPFHLNLSVVQLQRGDLERALAHVDRAIELNPPLAQAHAQRGHLLLRMGRLEQALGAYDTASRLDPTGAGYALFAGSIAAELDRCEVAVTRLEAATRLNPDVGPAYLELARCRAELGDFPGAERALDRAAARLGGANPDLARIRAQVAELKSQR